MIAARHLTIFMSCLLCINCQDSETPFRETDIVLYSGPGVWEESLHAARNMFQWMGYSVTAVNAPYLNTEGLDGMKILCIPGGDMYQYARDISQTGKQHIRDFVASGGGYIGICGGGYFACEHVFWRGSQLPIEPLGLLPGSAVGPIDDIVPYPEYQMCKVNIVDTTHLVTQSQPDSAWMLYYWGPVFEPDHGAEVSILGTYDATGQNAMVALEYQLGKVFLIGTHPEIEEDSDRDSVEFGNQLHDYGSDWNTMRQAVLWCQQQE
jgi:biotin--protein ligase